MRNADEARAAFYPDISIGALAGLSSIDMDKLFESGSRVFNVSPAIHLPIFEGGRLEARFGASKAELETAAAQAVGSVAPRLTSSAVTACAT